MQTNCDRFKAASKSSLKTTTWFLTELINSIEITIAIAIAKRISQLLLLLLTRSSISIDFLFCLEYVHFRASAVGIIGKNAVKVVALQLKATNIICL